MLPTPHDPPLTSGEPHIIAAVDAAVAGDTAAFAVLYAAYAVYVTRYVRARIWSPDAADDIAHDAWVKAMENIHRFQWQGRPWVAWLFQVVRNTLIDHVRAANRDTRRALALTGPDTPTDHLAQIDRRDAARRLLEQIAPQYRDALILTHYCDLPMTLVADTMARTPNATRVLQHRARRALRDAARRDGLNGDDLLR